MRKSPLISMAGLFLLFSLAAGCATPGSLGYYTMGLESAYEDDPNDAARYFKRSLAKGGDRPVPGVHTSLAILYYRAGKTDDAIAELKRELAVYPSKLAEKLLEAMEKLRTPEPEGDSP